MAKIRRAGKKWAVVHATSGMILHKFGSRAKAEAKVKEIHRKMRLRRSFKR